MKNQHKRRDRYFAKQAHNKRMKKVRSKFSELILAGGQVVKAVDGLRHAIACLNRESSIFLNSELTNQLKSA